MPPRLASLALVATLQLLTPALLSAHGALRRSDPAAGTLVRAPLQRVVLEFTEAFESRFVRVTLSDSSGHRIERPTLVFSAERTVVTVTDTGLASLRGPVLVEWRIAGADGHPVDGEVRFVVDLPPDTVVPATSSPGGNVLPTEFQADARHWGRIDGPAASSTRWLQYVAVLALIGTWCAAAWIIPMARRRDAWPTAHSIRIWRTTRRMAIASSGILAIALGIRLASQANALGAETVVDLMALLYATAWGRGWVLCALGLTALVVLVRLRTRRPALVGLGVGLLALGTTMMGHASAAPAPLAAMITGTAHLLGAGVWLGSLSWLAVVALPATRNRESMRATTVRSFSTIALVGASVVAVSGLMSAWRFVGSVEAATTTAYGRILLAKLAVLSLVALTGFYNWRTIVPRIETERAAQRLRITAAIEIAVALMVLALVARLAVTPPPALGAP